MSGLNLFVWITIGIHALMAIFLLAKAIARYKAPRFGLYLFMFLFGYVIMSLMLVCSDGLLLFIVNHHHFTGGMADQKFIYLTIFSPIILTLIYFWFLSIMTFDPNHNGYIHNWQDEFPNKEYVQGWLICYDKVKYFEGPTKSITNFWFRYFSPWHFIPGFLTETWYKVPR